MEVCLRSFGKHILFHYEYSDFVPFAWVEGGSSCYRLSTWYYNDTKMKSARQAACFMFPSLDTKGGSTGERNRRAPYIFIYYLFKSHFVSECSKIRLR